MSLSRCKIINLPRVCDPRGNLTFVEGGRHVPFEIRRVYYLYDVPGGSERGGHAHRRLHQLFVAMSGSSDRSASTSRARCSRCAWASCCCLRFPATKQRTPGPPRGWAIQQPACWAASH